jgi:hypothetical protein
MLPGGEQIEPLIRRGERLTGFQVAPVGLGVEDLDRRDLADACCLDRVDS